MVSQDGMHADLAVRGNHLVIAVCGRPMSLNHLSDACQRRLAFEAFEERLVMSADPIAQILPQVEIPAVADQVEVRTELHEVNQITGVNQVQAETGFDGSGQTVVVIDSGIAYDHAALGGGLGSGYKVVGGWDFAENDADPYDDGPAGFHGTHVAGIIGSTDAWHTGVAPGVDLVALRVFDDNGNGNLEWVEQALEWVHENRSSFENPITTVNLSLGTDWNADNTPAWATLEDEFQQLEQDGIFISVAAGNDFQRYQTTGVSYPAASSFVVPIASSDGISAISDFSQRNDRVLVAPGEQIMSTVPDHLFGGSRTDQFLGASGTSMAAPYAAGASVLLRQAYQFMGIDNVTQDMLYEQFRATADLIYDSVTSSAYHQINIQRAIESVIPDQHGDTWQDATDAGVLQGGEQIKGVIGSRWDSDKFVFTAAESGTLTLTFETTDAMQTAVEVIGAQATVEGNVVRFDVQQGQQYQFAVGTQAGIGHYQIDVSLETRQSVVEWGAVRADAFDETVVGEQLFRMSASRSGVLTIHADVNQSSGPVTLQLYDAQMRMVDSATSASGELRFDVAARAGETFYLQTVADNANLEFAVLNLIQQSDDVLNVFGTSGNDRIDVTVGRQLGIQIQGVDYQFDASAIDSLRVFASSGVDAVNVTVDEAVNQADFRIGRADVVTDSTHLVVVGAEYASVDATSSVSAVRFFDSAGNDQFQANPMMAKMSGSGFVHTIRGLSGTEATQVTAFSSGGSDSASIKGAAGQDRLVALSDRVILKSGIDKMVLKSFDQMDIDGRGGDDTTVLYDTQGNDVFELRPHEATVVSQTRYIRASGFETMQAVSSSGDDRVRFFDSTGDDQLASLGNRLVMTGVGFRNSAEGFDTYAAFSTQGTDVAVLRGTSGDDFVVMTDRYATLTNQTFSVFVDGFQRVSTLADQGGVDVARIVGTTGNDAFYADRDSVSARLQDGILRRAVGFEQLDVEGRMGRDSARLNGSTDVDLLRALREGTTFESTMQVVRLTQIEDQWFDGNGGGDEVFMEDFQALDLLRAVGDRAEAVLNQQRIRAEGFEYLQAETAENDSSSLDYDGVDYLFMLRGDWSEQ